MQKYSITEVVEMAIQTERLGYEFYTTMAEKFQENTGLVKLFNNLAMKEQVHERLYTELKGKVGDAEPVDWEEAQLYFRSVMDSEFFLGNEKALPSMENVPDVAHAVDYALGFEKETLLFFVGMRDAVADKDIVDQIIREERSHIAWLSQFRAAM